MYFSKLPDEFYIAFVGFGLLETDVVAAASRYPNTHFHPAVSQAELITLLRGADVGVFLPDGASASYQNSLPNKVFEYSAAGLGLLVSDAKDLNQFQHPSMPSAKPLSLGPRNRFTKGRRL